MGLDLLLDFDLSLANADQDLTAQVGGGRVAAAVLGHQLLDGFLEPELPEAGTALVQVLADVLTVGGGHLTVNVVVDLLQDLATWHLVRLSAAHDLPSSAVLPSTLPLACARA